jgi:hypothetical protein
MIASWGAGTLVFAVVGAGLLVAALFWYGGESDPRSEVVTDSSAPPGWKTIVYHSVQVEVPSSWARLDMSDCEFQLEVWAPSDSPPCDFEVGAAIFGSATFDPAHGPGLRRASTNRAGAATWGGYVYAGNFAVTAAGTDREAVQRVLESARAPGTRAPSAQ